MDKLEEWLARFDNKKDPEPEEVANMNLPDYATLLEENEYR